MMKERSKNIDLVLIYSLLWLGALFYLIIGPISEYRRDETKIHESLVHITGKAMIPSFLAFIGLKSSLLKGCVIYGMFKTSHN